MYIALKMEAYFNGNGNGNFDVEMPRLFDVPLSYLLRPPEEGYRCSGCWDEFREDVKICVDCNKEIIDFAKTEFIDWKFDYDAMDKVGFLYDEKELETKLQKLKEDREYSLTVFARLMDAYKVWLDEEISAEEKKKIIDEFMSVQDEKDK